MEVNIAQPDKPIFSLSHHYNYLFRMNFIGRIKFVTASRTGIIYLPFKTLGGCRHITFEFKEVIFFSTARLFFFKF